MPTGICQGSDTGVQGPPYIEDISLIHCSISHGGLTLVALV